MVVTRTDAVSKISLYIYRCCLYTYINSRPIKKWKNVVGLKIKNSAGARELEAPSQIQLWGPNNGSLGAEPPPESRDSPQHSPGGHEGKAPLKLKHFWLLNV